MNHFSEKVSFIWSVADLLRGPYKPAQYGRVILPLTVLRRLDCVLEPTKAKVLARAASLKGGKIGNVDPILNRITGISFHNTSKLDFQKLKGEPDKIAANLTRYIKCFSTKGREIIDYFGFEAGDWSRHRISIYDAKAGGAPHDVKALRAAVADEATWKAAYECQFVDEMHALLPYELLQARVDKGTEYFLNAGDLKAGEFYAGYDVGRKHDMSVLVVLEKLEDRSLRWRGAVELRQAPFDEQHGLLADLLQRDYVYRLCIDQSGLGMQLAEQLAKKFCSVEPITMTAPMKESLASRILAVFQAGELEIPDHRPLIEDLHSMERTITLAGNVRYSAPRESGSHADRWTALALALHAAHNPYPELTISWV